MVFQTVHILESEIEDVLALYPEIARTVIGVPFDLTLVARQMEVPSGRLDLLFLGGKSLILVELKVQSFERDFLKQILEYRQDLLESQQNEQIVAGEVRAFLLCINATQVEQDLCYRKGVTLVVYSPEEVLQAFFDRMAGMSSFMTIRPPDYGVWNLHLLNRVLYALLDHNTLSDITQAVRLATNTVRNHLRTCENLLLVNKLGGKFFLTDVGLQYVRYRNASLPISTLSARQINLLREIIIRDPFASPMIFGIYSIVEVVFVQSRNTYPVPLDVLIKHFTDFVGKRFEWTTERSAFLGTKAYLNYAVELGLLGNIGNKVFLTPTGWRFILLLQLHKGIKLVDALSIA